MDERDINFIARHYRRGLFSAERGWRRLGLRGYTLRRRYRIAAAIGAFVVLTASAAIIYQSTRPAEHTEVESAPPAVHVDTGADNAANVTATPEKSVRPIDFENTPLPVVVEKVNDTYGVTLTNLPADADSYRLSLHYEGTAEDLVETINDILGINLEVSQE